MKLTVVFLVLCVALLNNSAAAFFVNSLVKDVTKPVAVLTHAMEDRAEAVAKPLVSHLNPLRLLLASMGIPAEQLLGGSKKCLDELGSEALQVIKALKVALTLFG